MLNKIKKLENFLYCLVSLVNISGRIPTKDKQTIKSLREWLKNNIECYFKNKILFEFSLSDASETLLLKARQEFSRYFKKDKPRILLVSHEYSQTGAPKALLMLCKSLQKIYETSPLVLTLKDGPMYDYFHKEGVKTIFMPELPFMEKDLEKFFEEFDIVIANSCSWDLLYLYKYIKCPTVWWSHEVFEEDFYIDRINGIIDNIDLFLGGSPLTMKYMQDNFDTKDSDLLFYGLEEQELPENNTENKIIFSLMGTIEERKGTDIFIDAIRKLPKETRQKAKFKIIGDCVQDGFDEKLTKKAKGLDEIEFLPSMPLDDLFKQYAQSDVIVSASRNDPMPIVLTYAFMFSKLCLSSDSTGTSLLIDDMETGVLFESENIKDLSTKMSDIIEDNEKYQPISKAGYKIYEENFSTEFFNKKIKQNIDKYLAIKS